MWGPSPRDRADQSIAPQTRQPQPKFALQAESACPPNRADTLCRHNARGAVKQPLPRARQKECPLKFYTRNQRDCESAQIHQAQGTHVYSKSPLEFLFSQYHAVAQQF